MNKASFVSAVSDKAGFSKRECDIVIKAVVQTIQEELSKGEKIQIPDLGTFKITERAEKKVRNPRTNEYMVSKPCNLAKFSPATSLKSAINTTKPVKLVTQKNRS